MRSDVILFKHIDYLIVKLLIEIVLLNSLVLSNKLFNFRRFFRWALDSKGGREHAPNDPSPMDACLMQFLLFDSDYAKESYKKAIAS